MATKDESIQPVTAVDMQAAAHPADKLRAFGGKIKDSAAKSVAAVTSVVDDFKEFLNRGNVFDLAVGLVMGTAFTAIVNSFVSDIITPFIGLASSANLANSYIILKCPSNFTDCRGSATWGTPAVANAAGAVTWNWGKFLDSIINFSIISAILFFFVKIYAATFRRKDPKKNRDCSFCFMSISKKATKCPHCTSELLPVEDTEEGPSAPPVVAMISNVIPQAFRPRKQ